MTSASVWKQGITIFENLYFFFHTTTTREINEVTFPRKFAHLFCSSRPTVRRYWGTEGEFWYFKTWALCLHMSMYKWFIFIKGFGHGPLNGLTKSSCNDCKVIHQGNSEGPVNELFFLSCTVCNCQKTGKATVIVALKSSLWELERIVWSLLKRTSFHCENACVLFKALLSF